MFQNFENGELLWFATFICIIILVLLAWLIMRRARLWYWKVDTQIDTLKSIDEKLKQLEGELKENCIVLVDESNGKGHVDVIDEAAQEHQEHDEQIIEETDVLAELAVLAEQAQKIGAAEPDEPTEQFKPAEKRNENIKTVNNIDKSGRAYTEEDLEKLIKD